MCDEVTSTTEMLIKNIFVIGSKLPNNFGKLKEVLSCLFKFQ